MREPTGRSEPWPAPLAPGTEPEKVDLRVLVKAASLAVLALHDPVCPDADLLHPLPQRIQHGSVKLTV
jgi:hypothetical protein